METITEFYKELYGKQHECEEEGYKRKSENKSKVLYSNPDPTPAILKEEVENAITKLKIGKAPGPDKIENSIIKMFKEVLMGPLVKLFNLILEYETIPEQWELSEIIFLHKKRDKYKVENYRPLSLTSSVSKIFMKLLKNRIYNQLDRNQPVEQAGFQRGFSNIDHIHALNQLFEKAREYNIELHCIFVDFSKAFDSIDHKKFWEALNNQGTESKIIRIQENVYGKVKAYIKTDIKGEIFRVGRGVKQGDPLSPNLLNAVLESAFRMLEWEGGRKEAEQFEFRRRRSPN